MAGQTFSETPLFGMMIRESATDGSDFTNPAADYRRLFLGEDGLLHLKDSAGVVTDPIAAASVANDAIWDAAGDLAQGTGSNTAAKLGAGTAGYVLTSAGAAAPLVWAKGGIAIATTLGSGSADYTTTSTTFVDVDGTNLIITPTLAQTGDILEIMATFVVQAGSSVANAGLTFGIAGADVGDTLGLLHILEGTTPALVTAPVTLVYHHTMPSGTQPAILLRWKTGAGTVTMYNRTTHTRPRMSVKNLSRGGTL